MKKKILVWSCAYYIGVLAVYMGILCLTSLVLNIFDETNHFANIALATYIIISIIIVILMRFSMFKWYVDPFAAIEATIFVYGTMIINQMKYTKDFYSAFLLVGDELGDDGGMGYWFLVGLFIFGLIASFSPARKRGENISHKLLISKNCYSKSINV